MTDILSPHTMKWQAVAEVLAVDPETGLSSAEAEKRQKKHGFNELPVVRGRGIGTMLLDQLRNLLVVILILATLVSVLIGEYLDASVITIIIILNAILGVVQEYRAEKSLDQLKKLAAPRARVLRNGIPEEIFSRDVVPGDIILLEAGNYLPADGRICRGVNLALQESSLTGESLPVDKDVNAVLGNGISLGDRINMVFSGTLVTRGRGRAIITATGAGTELGKVAQMIAGVGHEQTPLQKKLARLGYWLTVVILSICAVVFASGLLRGLPALDMFMTSVSLAVAAIPEGLPAVITIVLAIGMQNMVKRHAIIRRLQAVETLGCTTVICSDKTGTLTQNAMVVKQFYLPSSLQGKITGERYVPKGRFTINREFVDPTSSKELVSLLEAAALCNDALIVEKEHTWKPIGDPTEAALICAAAKAGLGRKSLNISHPRVHEIPFDSVRKSMSTIHRDNHYYIVFVKGAVDLLINNCISQNKGGDITPLSRAEREEILTANARFASEGLRVLACAYRSIKSVPNDICPSVVERELIFLGLLAMEDPLRLEAKTAVSLCHRSGIRPIMVTGDFPDTAAKVGEELGLMTKREEVLTSRELNILTDQELREKLRKIAVFARVSPEDKLRIVNLLKAQDEVVAMTGDGINDAPALKRADIGVAMGITGTDVAKEASDMILTDDNFASIVTAVEEGRVIFDNIRKFIIYLLSCNISEVLVIFVSILMGLPSPLFPVQILWVNLVTDGLPALALGLEPRERGVMKRAPRRLQEGLITREIWFSILGYGVLLSIVVLVVYLFCLRQYPESLEVARTAAFTSLVLCQLVHAFNCRSHKESVFKLRRNLWLLGAVTLSILLQLSIVYYPFAHRLFKTTMLSGFCALLVILSSISLLVLGEVKKLLKRKSTQ